ncbi:hypothetical protein [Streptomyces sp. AC602_WCS936]|uniref:hypothetical protein n=1 Tax=Streptomyces sp. AC602_WCS936 TaxID=2823685 RepID=UPI001C271D60|nr:hypothetical protein [Streptomyces sp. AC602_WCS936]
MSEGWVAVVSAAAGLVGAALGAIGGYFSGRAQARGTVEGVQLQLSGQQAEALWQAEIDACAQFVDACNRALFKLGQLLGVAGLDHEQEQQLSVYGIGSRDQLLRELRDLQDECTLREVTLLLRMPTTEAESARAVGHALTLAANGLHLWCAARAGQTEDEPDRRRDAHQGIVTYRQVLKQFTITAQQRFAQPHGAAVETRQRSLFRRRA